jgi:hypothetical protein
LTSSVGLIFVDKRTIGGSISVAIRKGWSFSGKMIISAAQEPHRRLVQLHLSVNPTRFAAHAERLNVNSIAELAERSIRELLICDPAYGTALKQQTLDRNDNFIPHTQWIFFATRNWDELVRLYLTTIKTAIETDFAERAI